MSAQGLEVIDHTVQLTHEWINELAGRLGYSSRRSALHLLRVVLHRIRDHLLIDEVAQVSAQLPVLIRGFFYEGWVPKRTPIKERDVADFVGYIASQMEDAEEFRGHDDVKCVFDLLNARISEGEIAHIRTCLPSSLRKLWPAP